MIGREKGNELTGGGRVGERKSELLLYEYIRKESIFRFGFIVAANGCRLSFKIYWRAHTHRILAIAF